MKAKGVVERGGPQREKDQEKGLQENIQGPAAGADPSISGLPWWRPCTPRVTRATPLPRTRMESRHSTTIPRMTEFF